MMYYARPIVLMVSAWAWGYMTGLHVLPWPHNLIVGTIFGISWAVVYLKGREETP